MITSTIAKQNDGEVQITFNIPASEVKKAQERAVAEFAKTTEVAGFRKGKAPLYKVKEKIPQNTLLEHTLRHILPKALAEAIKKHNLKLAIYPKFELVKAKEGKDWQIRAVTCELPDVNLGDIKKVIPGEIRAASLKKELTKEEKEQIVIKTLLEKVKPTIPKVLIEEEVNSRLSNLLSRLEKLGLALENYLKSINKTSESLRAEYEKSASDTITLDLILNKVAQEEKVEVNQKEIEEALKLRGQANQGQSQNQQDQKRFLEAVLKRNKALEKLTNLN